jgi:hypothetical protein
MIKTPGDLIILPADEGRWIVMNVFARTCLCVDGASLQVLGEAETVNGSLNEDRYEKQTFELWEIEHFPNYNGLLADPTPFIRNYNEWPDAVKLNLADLIERFQKHYLLIENEAEYRLLFKNKTSLMDWRHFGDFHQRLGQELSLVYREQAEEWWVR